MGNRRTYEEISEEEILSAVKRLDQPTTAEICRELSCRGKAARLHLEELHEEGKISREALKLVRRWSIPESEK